MPSYRFAGEYPHILLGLSYDDTTVTRDGARVNGTGTVIGQPGDVIDTDTDYESTLLEPIIAPTDAAEPSSAPKLTKAQLEAQALAQADAEFAAQNPTDTPSEPATQDGAK